MKLEDMAVGIFAALLGALMVKIYGRKTGPGRKTAISALLGPGFLAVFNYFGGFLGVTLGFNVINAFFVAVLGPAGVPVLLFSKWILSV